MLPKLPLKSCSFLGVLSMNPIWLQLSKNLFKSRTESYFDTTITSLGVMLNISDVLVKYDLFQYFKSWFNDSAFSTNTDWKRIVRYKIQVFPSFANSHPDMHVAQSCFENMSIQQFWSIADEYPDLVTRLHSRLGSWVILALMHLFLG